MMLANPVGDSILFGLYVGDDAITYTAPVFGFSSTAAPQLPRNRFCASFCAPTLRCSTRLFPRTVVPLSWSVILSQIVPRFAFDEVRYAFCERSRPARA